MVMHVTVRDVCTCDLKLKMLHKQGCCHTNLLYIYKENVPVCSYNDAAQLEDGCVVIYYSSLECYSNVEQYCLVMKQHKITRLACDFRYGVVTK